MLEGEDYLYNGSRVRIKYIEEEFGVKYAKVFFLDWVEEGRENKSEIVLVEKIKPIIINYKKWGNLQKYI